MRIFLSILLVAFSTTTLAQTVEPQTNLEQSISVGYVLIPFVATDSSGRPVRDLAPKDVYPGKGPNPTPPAAPKGGDSSGGFHEIEPAVDNNPPAPIPHPGAQTARSAPRPGLLP